MTDRSTSVRAAKQISNIYGVFDVLGRFVHGVATTSSMRRTLLTSAVRRVRVKTVREILGIQRLVWCADRPTETGGDTGRWS